MILGHSDVVFTGKGEHEIALAKTAESFIQEFELLIKIVLDGPICSTKEETASTKPSVVNFSHQLETFDTAWCCYLYHVVVWKVQDAELLEKDLMRAACNAGLTNDVTIRKQISEDQKLLRTKAEHLSSTSGMEHMGCVVAGMQSRPLEVEVAGLVASPNEYIYSPSSPGSSDDSRVNVTDEISGLAKGCDKSGSVEFLFKADDSSSSNKRNTCASRSSTDGNWGPGTMLATENEVLVNEIVHEHHHGFADSLGIGYEDQQSVMARVKETVDMTFQDGVMETLKQDEPDYSWVLKLMEEVRDELCGISPSSWRQEIVETIDVEILEQVLESGILDMDYFGKILEFSLITLCKLSAPANEDEMKTTHHNLLKELGEISHAGDKSNISFAVILIKGLRFVLRQIQMLRKEISKAQIKMLEPFIKGPAGLEYLKKAFTNRYGSPTSAPVSLPSTVQWLSSMQINSEHEREEYIDSVSSLTTGEMRWSQRLSPSTLQTGGSILMVPTSGAPTSIGLEQPECKGEKVDLLLRIGLLKLVSEVKGLMMETLPETLKLNLHRLRTVQSQLQKIIVISTSILVLRQTLLSENLVTGPVEMDNVVSQSIKQLSHLLDSTEDDVGISEIIETLNGFCGGGVDPQKLQARKEFMANMLAKSMRAGDAVLTRVSRAVCLATRGIVLGGSSVKGRQLAEGALKRLGAASLAETLAEALEVLIVVATVSGKVHREWYEEILRHV